MIEKVEYKNMQSIRKFFCDIRFFMGNSVLEGMMGSAFADNHNNPNIAFLTVKKYCFISGNIENEKLKKIIDNYFKEYNIIPSDDLCVKIEEIYKDEIIKSERYAIKKNVLFDKMKLNQYVNELDKKYNLMRIDDVIERRIKEEKFIHITDNYKKYGLGFCCLYNSEIIGVASSNIFYRDGIEVNIKVKENFRRQGIATAITSKLILECLKMNKKISWDAANKNSVALAEKLGFEYDSTYNVYKFE